MSFAGRIGERDEIDRRGRLPGKGAYWGQQPDRDVAGEWREAVGELTVPHRDSYHPVVTVEVLGKRWTPRILWERRDGPLNFRNLKELREMGFVDLTDEGYGYSASGRELGEHLLALSEWSARWDREKRYFVSKLFGPSVICFRPPAFRKLILGQSIFDSSAVLFPLVCLNKILPLLPS